MKEFVILFAISLILELIIANFFGLDWSNASAIADLIITMVLVSLAIPFAIMSVQDYLRKNRKK